MQLSGDLMLTLQLEDKLAQEPVIINTCCRFFSPICIQLSVMCKWNMAFSVQNSRAHIAICYSKLSWLLLKIVFG